MQTIKYQTGRHYGAPQVLEITVPAKPADELADVAVAFADAARGIAGVVTVLGFELDSSFSLRAAVMREYDAGRYALA